MALRHLQPIRPIAPLAPVSPLREPGDRPPITWAGEVTPSPAVASRQPAPVSPFAQPAAQPSPQYVPPSPVTKKIIPFDFDQYDTVFQPKSPQPSGEFDIDEDTKWWEQPAAIAESAMGGVAKSLGKVPFVSNLLKLMEPIFKGMHNMERAFGTVILAPFSPRLPYRKGESWFDHEQREYDAWDAPTYVKGIAEFTPWLIPWAGWVGWSAKAVGFGGSLAKTGVKMVAKGKKVQFRTESWLNNNMFGNDLWRKAANWAEHKPVLHYIVNKFGGPAAFVKPPQAELTVIDQVKRASVNRGIITSQRHDVKSLLLPSLEKYGAPKDILGLSGNGLANKNILRHKKKRGGADPGQGANDLMESFAKNPDSIEFIGPAGQKAKEYMLEVDSIAREIEGFLVREGIYKEGHRLSYHRIVEGRTTAKGFVKTEYGSLFEISRSMATMEKGVAAGYRYNGNLTSVLDSMINHYVRKVGTHRFNKVINKLGKTVHDLAMSKNPQLMRKHAKLVVDRQVLLRTLKVLLDLKSSKGTLITQQKINKIREGLTSQELKGLNLAKKEHLDDVLDGTRGAAKDIADEIDFLLQLSPEQTKKVIEQLSPTIIKAMGIKDTNEIYKVLQNIVTPVTPAGKHTKLPLQHQGRKQPFRFRDIEEAIKRLTKDKEQASKAIMNLYIDANRLNLNSWNEGVQGVIKKINGKLAANADVLFGEKAFVKKKVRGKDVLVRAGKREGGVRKEKASLVRELGKVGHLRDPAKAKFMTQPAFKNKIFDEEIVRLVEKSLGDQGQTWLRRAAATSGVGRTLIAALDLSAPFIQGLPVFGRNPFVWAKATARTFEFMARPSKLRDYLTDPTAAAIRRERISAGGSGASFEYVEQVPMLRRAAEAAGRKLGQRVGREEIGEKIGQQVVAQTYGRAEAAFIGFGVVARDELWKALRRKNMNSGDLRLLARSIDRMTGQLSSEALGIGLTQRQFESAFVFFSPRYTRAGLSLMGDVLRGGLTGSEARKALAGLLAGGTAMYYGVCKALGQQPDLNPTTANFMTVNISGHNVGVGGVTYGLMRLLSNVVVTAAEAVDTKDPSAFLDVLNRRDNPFTKFMYNRSSPLTGLAVGVALEQEDFFGEPFENPGDWAAFIAEKVIPISMQEVMPWKPTPASPQVFAATFGGLRAYPKSNWELRNEARDSYAQKDYQRNYVELNALEQIRVDEYPDIKSFEREIQEWQTKHGSATDIAFGSWNAEKDLARLYYENELQMAQNAVDAGLLTGYDFKESYQNASYGYGMAMEMLKARPEYKAVYEVLAESAAKDINTKYIGDVAYTEYTGPLYSGSFENEYGIYDYDAANAHKEEIRQKYGDSVFNYIITRQAENKKTLPPLAQEYYKAREILKPYWEVKQDADRYFGVRDTPAKDRWIARRRKYLRRINPEIAYYYNLFYVRED
jgi:hypothetical protein